jgi:hypothetical protein
MFPNFISYKKTMQRLIILLAFLFFSVIAKASCSPSGIYSWPTTSTVKSNPVFVLTFYAFSQGIVAGLNKQYAVYLRSGEQKVPLLISETCRGQFRLTQVILKPARQLTPGMEYELVIDSLPKYEHILKWNKELLKSEYPSWKVLKEADTDLPAWTTLPKYQSKSIAYFGCGPSLSVVFGFGAEDGSDILIKTTVQNTRTGKYTTYYLEPTDKTRIGVGHGMCSGAFDFETDDEYEVSFALMDASGNPGCVASAPIRFTRPDEKDKSE